MIWHQKTTKSSWCESICTVDMIAPWTRLLFSLDMVMSLPSIFIITWLLFSLSTIHFVYCKCPVVFFPRLAAQTTTKHWVKPCQASTSGLRFDVGIYRKPPKSFGYFSEQNSNHGVFFLVHYCYLMNALQYSWSYLGIVVLLLLGNCRIQGLCRRFVSPNCTWMTLDVTHWDML